MNLCVLLICSDTVSCWKELSQMDVPEKKVKLYEKAPILQPTILWGRLTYSSSVECAEDSFFPSREEYHGWIKNDSHLRYLPSFLYAIMDAYKVDIIDQYFDITTCKMLSIALGASNVQQIRVICGQKNRLNLSQYEENMNQARHRAEGANGKEVFNIKVKWIQENTRNAKKIHRIHDRYALIDSELWHFGGNTACNMRSLTCATRGWSVLETKADIMFNYLWQEAHD